MKKEYKKNGQRNCIPWCNFTSSSILWDKQGISICSILSTQTLQYHCATTLLTGKHIFNVTVNPNCSYNIPPPPKSMVHCVPTFLGKNSKDFAVQENESKVVIMQILLILLFHSQNSVAIEENWISWPRPAGILFNVQLIIKLCLLLCFWI